MKEEDPNGYLGAVESEQDMYYSTYVQVANIHISFKMSYFSEFMFKSTTNAESDYNENT